jgi:hypothetical protein
MAEFQDNLGAPSDYQRPVKTQQEGVNIFGAAADLFRGFNQANRAAAANTPSPAEQRAEATAQGLDVFAAGAASIMSNTKGGPGDNILSYFGAAAQPLFDELRRVNEAASDGEITSQVREVQIERLISGVMGKYPEASYEIMGQALSQLGIDHAFARAWKLQLRAKDQAETDALAAESEAHKAAAAAGENGSRSFMIQKGKEILKRKHLDEEQKRALDIAILLNDQESKLTEAERRRLEAQHKGAVKNISDGILFQNSVSFGPIFESLHNWGQTIEDPDMAQRFTDVLKRSRAELSAGRTRAIALLSSVRASDEDLKRVNEWFDLHERQINELEAGDTSYKKTTASMMKLIKDTAAIEESEIVPVYQRLVGALGQGMVQGILTGTIPGISPNELKYIREELIAGFAQGRVTSEEAKKTIAAFQAAKDGTAIPRIADEDQRKRTMNAAFTELNGTIGLLTQDLSATPSKIDLDTFQGSTVTLLSAVIEDAPTITLDNIEKVAPVIASAKWRHVAKLALEKGSDAAAASKMIQYDTVAVAKTLNTLKRQYLNSGQVRYDPTKQAYVPVAKSSPTPMSARQLDRATPQKTTESSIPQEAVRAATVMNSLLSHLEQVDVNILEVVPDDKLISKDSEGSTSKMSVKDVFATDDGFLNSLANFEQFQQESPELKSVKDKFFEDTDKFLKTQMGGAAFDYSSISESPAYIQSRINAAEIRMGGRSNIQLPVTDMKSYMTRLAATEGGGLDGNTPHDLTRSSAAGTYGFTRGTWLEFVDKAVPSAAGLSERDKLEMMKDQAIEDKIMEAFTKENFVMLKNELGKDPSWDELNVAHMLRYETPKFLKALALNPMAPARSVLSEATVRANPELTKGTLLDFWNMRLKRQDKDWESYMQQRQGVSSAPMPPSNYLEDYGSDDELFDALEGR